MGTSSTGSDGYGDDDFDFDDDDDHDDDDDDGFSDKLEQLTKNKITNLNDTFGLSVGDDSMDDAIAKYTNDDDGTFEDVDGFELDDSFGNGNDDELLEEAKAIMTHGKINDDEIDGAGSDEYGEDFDEDFDDFDELPL